jgi:hypothetical protein
MAMTFAQVAGLGVRLFALWLFLFCLQGLASAVALRNTLGDLSTGQTALVLAPALIAVAVAIFLWRLPLGIARILIPRGAEKSTDITLKEAWRLGSVLLGLLTLASAAPTVLRVLVVMFLTSDAEYAGVPIAVKPDLVFSLAKMGFGCFLVFGSDYIYRRFGAARQSSGEN